MCWLRSDGVTRSEDDARSIRFNTCSGGHPPRSGIRSRLRSAPPRSCRPHSGTPDPSMALSASENGRPGVVRTRCTPSFRGLLDCLPCRWRPGWPSCLLLLSNRKNLSGKSSKSSGICRYDLISSCELSLDTAGSSAELRAAPDRSK
eukprot:Blabericola_migrator_1__4626@NODE_2451_length_2739_cov_88_021332_g1535_i0_p2_GENE_NODE_2451_length_2739_cov_88_021332_g1535_i0NODE_2451_length_2739_cov_88_021332_g1535_i0_p2_ORF_typecomplete_len147_score1_47CARD_2/PF16739_5/0_32_NODE_2451_length_2739_cov_88_021332_g1535_i021222562